MPIYNFVCPNCTKSFEKLVRNMEFTHPICPECGEETEQTVSVPSQFVWGKGGGWS